MSFEMNVLFFLSEIIFFVISQFFKIIEIKEKINVFS